MMTEEQTVELVNRLIADEHYLEAGFVDHFLSSAPDGLPALYLDATRHAFFFGAKHMIFLILKAHKTTPDGGIRKLVTIVRKECVEYEDRVQKMELTE